MANETVNGEWNGQQRNTFSANILIILKLFLFDCSKHKNDYFDETTIPRNSIFHSYSGHLNQMLTVLERHENDH